MATEPLDLEALSDVFCEVAPHNRALGMKVVAAAKTPTAWATVTVPWHDRLIGNPKTRVPHSGVIATLIDSCSGIAAYLKLDEAVPIATLDLRVDSLKPAKPDLDLFARAECLRVTRNVAFIRAIAFQQGGEDEPFSTAAATFMIMRGASFQRPL